MASTNIETNKKTDFSNKLSKNDDLDLNKMTIREVPGDVLFPEELNQYLRGQIEFLTQLNGQMQRTITEKDLELKNSLETISDLKSKISQYEILSKEGAPPGGGPTHLMSAKIVELSKKLREKNCEIESIKTKHTKLQQKFQLISKERLTNDTPTRDGDTEAESKKSDNSDEIKSLHDKLSATTNKLFEVKNINLQLKNDLKIANKMLQQELGDGFTSVQSMSSNSNWRGRAQQIIGLQQKNSELLEKLNSLSEKESIAPAKNDNRKQIIDQLQKDLNTMKQELEDTRKKLNGARARVKVLETECHTLKSRLNSAHDKHSHDEQLIKILTNQVSSLEEAQIDLKKEKQMGYQKLEVENKNLHIELSKEKCIQENLKKSLADKESQITELQNDIQCLKNYSVQNNSSRCSSAIQKQNSVNKDQQQYTARVHVLEVEVNRLLELVQVLQARLDDERAKHQETLANYRRERQKAAKLEVRLSREELEKSMNKSLSYSKSKSSVTEEISNSQLCLQNMQNNLELAEENITSMRQRLDLLQKEKELDYQRFSSIISETSSMLKRFNTPNTVTGTSHS